MKSKGFTLVELLAVISILSLLALITSTVISNSLREAKIDLTDTQNKSIKLAAEAWGSDNINKLPTSGNCAYITIQDLIDDGFLESKVINPSNKSEISTDLKIKITNQQNKKNLIYEVNSISINNCNYIGNPIHVDLPKGLTPVVYDEDKNSWRVPKDSEDWYNYDEQKWANAVVLGKGKTKKAGEIVTVEGENPEALMMLVYIPRYEYKIEGQYGKHSNGTDGTAVLPGEIKVNFIKNTQLTADDGYILHPAFEYGNTDNEKQHLSGIWVGKFEISHTTKSHGNDSSNYSNDDKLNCTTDKCAATENLRVLPGVPSLRYNNVENFWYGIKSIENTQSFGLSNIDTHMMKNSEWGAVAYLSQSKYGKYGNSDYEGAQKEVYINNSSRFYTGRSGGNPGGNTKIKDTYTDQTATTLYADYGYYTYDGYLLSYNTNNKTETRDINKGAGASTTGNIYGVYDMSGGSEEFVMGVLASNMQIFNNKIIESKYYDIYITNDVTTSCKNNEPCYGHALSETKTWYNDYSEMVDTPWPWLARGDFFGNSVSNGVFGFRSVFNAVAYSISTRFVGIAK